MNEKRVSYPLPLKQPLAVQLFFAHLLLLLLSLPFDRMYSHLVMISFLLQALLSVNLLRRPVAGAGITANRKKILLPAAVLFCTAFSLTYSPMKAEGSRELLLQTPLLLLPFLLLLVSPCLITYRNALLMAFSITAAATAIYLFANAGWTIRHFHLPAAAIFSPAFTNHNFSEPVKMHATYLSMQWALAFVFLLQQAAVTTSALRRYLLIGMAVILLAGLLQLCSKSVGASLICIAFIGWPLVIQNRLKRRRAIGISIAVAAIMLGMVAARPVFRERYLTDLQADFIHPAAGELAESRLARWTSAIEVARKTPVFGQGAGTEKTILHEIFFKKKYYNSFLNHLNAHSQYVSLFFKTGITGLLVYLLVLTLGFREAIRRRDLLYLSFLVLVSLVSLGENILDLDKGVYFYSLFFAFFLFFPETHPVTQPAPDLSRNNREQRPESKPAVITAFAGNNT